MALRARCEAWLRYWRSLVWWQGSGCSRSFDPVGEFLKPFVTGPNRIFISTKENRDEDGQKAVAESQGEEGTSAAVGLDPTEKSNVPRGAVPTLAQQAWRPESHHRHGSSALVYRMLKYGQQYVDKGAEYYEQRNRRQQIEFVRKKAAQLGLQVTAAHA